MPASPEERKAKMRYKVLSRELTRLRERGSTDVEIEGELAKIEAEFPEMVQALGGKAPAISKETAQMLNFAETMAQDDQPAEAPKPKPQPQPSAETTAAPQSAGKEERTTPLLSPTPDSQTTSPVEPTPPSGLAKKSKGSSWSTAFFLGAVQAVGIAMRVWMDLNARPILPRVSQAKIFLFSFFIAVLHAAVVDPCSIWGRVIDPSLIAVMLHVQFALEPPEGAPSKRSFAERIFVYTVREFLPSIVSGFVVYSLTLAVLGLISPMLDIKYVCV